MRRTCLRFTAASLVLMLAFTAAAQAQVLNQVPANALLVVKIKNLQETSGKIAALAQQFGVAQLNPAMNDPLGFVMQQAKMAAGVDKAGDAAFVMMPPPAGEAGAAAAPGAKPSGIFLLPVSDYKAFIGNYPEATTEGDITTYKAPNEPQTLYVTNWGSFAAITPDKALLAPKPEGLKVQGLAAKEMDAKDIVVFANIPAVRAIALTKLQQARPRLMAEFEKNMANAPATQQKFAPAAKAALNQGLNMVEGFLNQCQAATFGLSLGKDGIGTTCLAEFDPASYTGQTLAAIKGTDQPLVVGLPESKYMFVGGCLIDPKVAVKLLDDAAGPVVKELNTAGEDVKPLVSYVDSLKTALGSISAESFGLLAPTGQIGQEGLLQSVTVLTGDAKAILEAQKSMFNSQQQMMELFGTKAGQVKTTVTANAKTVEGVSFDQLQTQFSLTPQTPEEMQMAQMMTWMYGPNGMNMYTGAVDDRHVAAIMGGNDALIAQVVAAVKAQANPLANLEPVKAVSAQLPANRVLVAYVPVDAIVASVINIAKQFRMPVGIQLPENLPPIGMSVSTDASALRADSYIPSQLVQSLISAGMQAFMMRAQPQPGAPGGGGL